MKNVSNVLIGLSFITLASCGKNDSSSSPKAEPLRSEKTFFKAQLSPINAHLGGDITGDAWIKVKGGTFTAEVRVNGASSQVMHAQHIHIADACPSLADDVNKDGIIDGAEGANSYGKILIPLDGDLSNQMAGLNNFPSSDFAGNYYYGAEVSTKNLLDDLMATDVDLTDAFIKLSTPDLNFAGKHIVIYGVAEATALPETVAAYADHPSHESLPIACGTYAKIDALEEGNTTNGRKD